MLAEGLRVRPIFSFVLLAAAAGSVAAQPLPRPRPASAGTAAAQPAPPEGPPLASACRLRLNETVAIAPSIAPIHGQNGCAAEDVVRLEAVVLPDKSRVAVNPP